MRSAALTAALLARYSQPEVLAIKPIEPMRLDITASLAPEAVNRGASSAISCIGASTLVCITAIEVGVFGRV